jgi:hypothetical protein
MISFLKNESFLVSPNNFPKMIVSQMLVESKQHLYGRERKHGQASRTGGNGRWKGEAD